MLGSSNKRRFKKIKESPAYREIETLQSFKTARFGHIESDNGDHTAFQRINRLHSQNFFQLEKQFFNNKMEKTIFTAEQEI